MVLTELGRRRQLDVQDALRRRDERVELVGDLGKLRGASLLRDEAELTTSSSEPFATSESTSAFTRESTSGFSSSAVRSGAFANASRNCCSCECTASSLPASSAASNSAFA